MTGEAAGVTGIRRVYEGKYAETAGRYGTALGQKQEPEYRTGKSSQPLHPGIPGPEKDAEIVLNCDMELEFISQGSENRIFRKDGKMKNKKTYIRDRKDFSQHIVDSSHFNVDICDDGSFTINIQDSKKFTINISDSSGFIVNVSDSRDYGINEQDCQKGQNV